MESKGKIAKLILILILIFVVIFTLNLIRKAVILRNITKVSKENYQYVTNFYEKITDNQMITEIWRKDDIALIKKTFENENKTEITYIDKDYKYVIKDDTVTKSNKEGTDLPILTNAFVDVPNFVQAILSSLVLNISSEKVYGEDCYYISTDTTSILYNIMNFNKDSETTYSFVNKETKLASKKITNIAVMYYNYELNNVKDEDIKMPDIEGLKLIDETK